MLLLEQKLSIQIGHINCVQINDGDVLEPYKRNGSLSFNKHFYEAQQNKTMAVAMHARKALMGDEKVRNWDRPSPERVRELENMSNFYWPTRKDQIFQQFAADAPRTDHQNLAVPDIGLKFLSENSVNLRHDAASVSLFWSNLLQTLKLTQIFHNLFFFRATTSSSFTSSVVPGPGEASLAQQTTTTTTKCWYNAKIDRKMALA